MSSDWWAVLTTLLFILCDVTSSAFQDVRTEDPVAFCQAETFRATCPANQVILMTSGRYGRMSLGRCVSKNLGYLGCAVDVLPFLDSRCSGRQTCEMKIMDTELRSYKPCPGDVTWYLEAAYTCVKVATDHRRSCSSGSSARLAGPHGYLVSSSTGSRAGSSPYCPWEIEASPGQKVNITVYNFQLKMDSGSMVSSSCFNVATVTDDKRRSSLTSCVGDTRAKMLYTSHNHKVKVEFDSRLRASPTPFLLRYEVTGCPEMTPPVGATASRTDTTLEVKCEVSGETWYMTCQDTNWVGRLGNCSDPNHVQPWAISNLFENENTFPFGILIVVAVGVALGIFLGGTLLILVSMHMKRRRRRQEVQTRTMDDDSLYYTEGKTLQKDLPGIEYVDDEGKVAFSTHKYHDTPPVDYKLRGPVAPYSTNPRTPHQQHVYESPQLL